MLRSSEPESDIPKFAQFAQFAPFARIPLPLPAVRSPARMLAVRNSDSNPFERFAVLCDKLAAASLDSAAWQVFLEELRAAVGGRPVAVSCSAFDRAAQRCHASGGFRESGPDPFVVRGGGGALPSVAIAVEQAGDPLDAEPRAIVEALAPLVARAFALAHSLDRATQRHAALKAALDAVPNGVIVLSAERNVLALNRTAAIWLAAEPAFSVEGERLVVREPHLQHWLDEAIASAARAGHDGDDARMLHRELPGGERTLAVASIADMDSEKGCVLLFTSDASKGAPLNPHTRDKLRGLYGLSTAEADVALGLCSGLSLREIAESRCVSLHTARSQLKQVLRKMGLSRQPDLIRVVLTSVAALSPEPRQTPRSCG